MKKIAILGSTGSIGTQTLEVVRGNQDIQVMALAAGSNIELLEAQIREFRPVLADCLGRRKGKRAQREYQRLECKSGIRDGWAERCGSAEGYRNPGDCDCWNDRNSSYD
ncbi:MAG: hypothetical protein ACLRMN_07830 [Mediterraneibacter gnavus]